MEEERDTASTQWAGRHIAAAVCAAVFSLILHGLFLYWLSSISFSLPIFPQPPAETQTDEGLHLVDVEPNPDATRIDPTRLVGGKALFPADLPSAAETLGRAPEEGAIEPPAVSEERFEGEAESVAEPSELPDRMQWEPRQELLKIDRQIAMVDEAAVPRRRIPDIERVANAADVVSRVDLMDLAESAPAVAGAKPVPGPPGVGPAEGTVLSGGSTGVTEVASVEEETAAEVEEVFEEAPAEVTPFKPIETYLEASIETYRPFLDRHYGYFRLEVQSAGDDVLPVLAKDIVLVQDSSASMAEQRLHFCRDGLDQCLPFIGPEDRFNVIGFSERPSFCFARWTAPEPSSLAAAKRFVAGMRSQGNTDIFSSMEALLKLPQTPGRPVIALLMTDGVPTTGLVQGSDIIGEFSRLNDGGVSVFALGTIQSANEYLLDLLTYCNRGDSRIVSRGRWGIPEAMTGFMEEISRPALSDVRFRFAEGGHFEVFPELTSNLYQDRPLVLYGRYPRDAEVLVFQAIGLSGEQKCDMIFNLPFGEAKPSSDKTIRGKWAHQKIYHLMGVYARTKDPDVLREIKSTSRAYHVDVPYRDKLPR